MGVYYNTVYIEMLYPFSGTCWVGQMRAVVPIPVAQIAKQAIIKSTVSPVNIVSNKEAVGGNGLARSVLHGDRFRLAWPFAWEDPLNTLGPRYLTLPCLPSYLDG